MQQAIISKDLIGDETLYHTKGWYHCKYFTLREDYCYIEDDSIVKEDLYVETIDTIPDNYWSDYNISFNFENDNRYAIFEYQFVKYRIPYKFYINIIDKIYCDVFAMDEYTIDTNNSKLIFYDDDKIIGWLGNCTFEILKNNTLAEDNANKENYKKNIPQDIEDNIIFKDITPFFDGISRVVYNDFCAKLDTNGNIIQKIKCKDCWFYEEYTKVKINGKWGVLDLSNNIIITPQYETLFYLGNNFWEISINNKKGIIDTLGNIILPTIYDELDSINDTHILAVKDSKYGVVDFSGKIIIPFHYDELESLDIKRKDFYFYATKNHTVGIIDINDNIIIPFIYKKLVYLNKNTIAAKIGENQFILINEKNERICSQIFENIHDNYDEIDIYPAQLNGLWGFIDEFGNKKIDFKYTDATKFKDGYCDVSIKKNPSGYNDYGLINKEGTLVLDYQYDINCTYVIDDDRFIVEQDNETYIVDRKGNVIVDNIYNWIIPLKGNNFLPVRLDDSHKGFIDRDGKPLKINKKTFDIPITPINYDNLSLVDKISVLFKGQKL